MKVYIIGAAIPSQLRVALHHARPGARRPVRTGSMAGTGPLPLAP